MNIPLSQPDITEAEIEAVVSVLRSSRLSIGPKQEEFEQRIATYVSLPHAIAVSSGTAGLHLCIRALGIGKGDEVIVPSFAFVSAAHAIRYEDATPVFVDIDLNTLNLDPARIEEAITPQTRAILVIHTFGCPANMDEIVDIARRHQLLLIEDACEAIGAEYRGRKIGTFGDAAVFAVYPNKQITTGEGGAVVTPYAELAQDIRALRNQAITSRMTLFTTIPSATTTAFQKRTALWVACRCSVSRPFSRVAKPSPGNMMQSFTAMKSLPSVGSLLSTNA